MMLNILLSAFASHLSPFSERGQMVGMVLVAGVVRAQPAPRQPPTPYQPLHYWPVLALICCTALLKAASTLKLPCVTSCKVLVMIVETVGSLGLVIGGAIFAWICEKIWFT